jgi:hypothetical protein
LDFQYYVRAGLFLSLIRKRNVLSSKLNWSTCMRKKLLNKVDLEGIVAVIKASDYY